MILEWEDEAIVRCAHCGSVTHEDDSRDCAECDSPVCLECLDHGRSCEVEQGEEACEAAP